MGDWYKVRIYQGHQGAGRALENHVFMFADDVMEVIRRYHTMPGVKRGIGRGRFPDVDRLSPEEGARIEALILAEERCTMRRAKSQWYYPPESRTLERVS